MQETGHENEGKASGTGGEGLGANFGDDVILYVV
jgi:hypothetical protein